MEEEDAWASRGGAGGARGGGGGGDFLGEEADDLQLQIALAESVGGGGREERFDAETLAVLHASMGDASFAGLLAGVPGGAGGGGTEAPGSAEMEE